MHRLLLMSYSLLVTTRFRFLFSSFHVSVAIFIIAIPAQSDNEAGTTTSISTSICLFPSLVIIRVSKNCWPVKTRSLDTDNFPGFPNRTWASATNHCPLLFGEPSGKMSNLGRSFRPSSYLASFSGLRPPMPCRTLSNSSEMSNHPTDDHQPYVFSGSNTPSSERSFLQVPDQPATVASSTSFGSSAETHQPQTCEFFSCWCSTSFLVLSAPGHEASDVHHDSAPGTAKKDKTQE